MIYRVPGNNEPYKEEGKIYYDEADMNRKFEEFLYNTCRGTDFGKLKNDNTVKVQCQMVRKPSKKEALKTLFEQISSKMSGQYFSLGR